MAFFVVKTPSNKPSKMPAYYSSSSDEEQELKKAPTRSSQKKGSSAGVNVGKSVKVKLPVKVKLRKATDADDSDSSEFSFPVPALVNLVMATARMACVTTGICVDWLETPEAHVFTACLGGITKEQLKVHLKGNGQEHILTISGEPFKGTLPDNSGLIKKLVGERLEPKYSRTFKVGCNLSVDQVTANVEGDFLTVTIPKITSAKYEAKTVNIVG